MKAFLLVTFLALGTASSEPLPAACEELARKTEATFRKMDESIKLKAGMLLGEMEAAKGALQGCIDRNEAVSTQMALIWLLGDLGLVSVLPLFFFHQRKMRRAILLASGLSKPKEQIHPLRIAPSNALYHWGMGLLITGFLGLNIVALFL